MASSSSTKVKDPDEDPYDVLGLEFPVTDDAVITKAYRKLALQYHPDKQRQTATQAEADAMAIKFHQLQQARAFLLDSEFQASRQAYDRKRASQRARQEHERAQREKLSGHRKRLQEELAAAEAEAKSKKQKVQSSVSKREELRRQGQAMREAHAAAQREREEKVAAKRETSVSARQVRLKWSRKRIKQSPSEDSIARDFGAKFGPVEAVEMIGHKGNAALVTFRHASSCPLCVEFYESSNEMRATYIKKPPEKLETTKQSSTTTTRHDTASTTTSRDYESVAEWQARRAAARAALAQQDENEEKEGLEENDQNAKHKTHKQSPQTTFSTDFLPTFPVENDASLSYWDQLNKLEEQILTPLLGKERIHKMNHP